MISSSTRPAVCDSSSLESNFCSIASSSGSRSAPSRYRRMMFSSGSFGSITVPLLMQSSLLPFHALENAIAECVPNSEYHDSQHVRSTRLGRQNLACLDLLSSFTLVIARHKIALTLAQPGQTFFQARHILFVPVRQSSRRCEVFRHGHGLHVTPILTQDISRYAVTIGRWVNRRLHRAGVNLFAGNINRLIEEFFRHMAPSSAKENDQSLLKLLVLHSRLFPVRGEPGEKLLKGFGCKQPTRSHGAAVVRVGSKYYIGTSQCKPLTCSHLDTQMPPSNRDATTAHSAKAGVAHSVKPKLDPRPGAGGHKSGSSTSPWPHRRPSKESQSRSSRRHAGRHAASR